MLFYTDLTNFMRPFFPICDIFCIFAEQKNDFKS